MRSLYTEPASTLLLSLVVPEEVRAVKKLLLIDYASILMIPAAVETPLIKAGARGGIPGSGAGRLVFPVKRRPIVPSLHNCPVMCLNILFCWFLMPGACDCRGTVSMNGRRLHEPKIARCEHLQKLV